MHRTAHQLNQPYTQTHTDTDTHIHTQTHTAVLSAPSYTHIKRAFFTTLDSKKMPLSAGSKEKHTTVTARHHASLDVCWLGWPGVCMSGVCWLAQAGICMTCVSWGRLVSICMACVSWCRLVSVGAGWYLYDICQLRKAGLCMHICMACVSWGRLVSVGAGWCQLGQDGVSWGRMVSVGTGWWQ